MMEKRMIGAFASRVILFCLIRKQVVSFDSIHLYMPLSRERAEILISLISIKQSFYAYDTNKSNTLGYLLLIQTKGLYSFLLNRR